MVSRNFTEIVKIGLCYGALSLAIIHYVWLNIKDKNPSLLNSSLKKLYILSFCFFAFVATLNYSRYNPFKLAAHYDSYDLLHYYINAKYFDELGYFNLTTALAIADKENGLFANKLVTHYLTQDENDYKKKKIEYAYKKSDEIKAQFSKDRWEEFKSDIYFLQRNKKIYPEHWKQLLLDHGFNGTPAWLVIASPLASNVSAEYAVYLTLIDPVLIFIMLLLVIYAFGSIPALFSLIFICICYSYRWPTISWAFLRYDWLFGIVASICFMKKEKYFLSGLFIGFSTLMRIFPILWVVCLGIKVILIFFSKTNVSIRERIASIPKGYFNFLYGFIFILLVFLAGSHFSHGLKTYNESFSNLTSHIKPHNLSSRRMGLAIATQYRGEYEQKFITSKKKELVQKLRPVNLIFGLALFMLLNFVIIKNKLSDWEILVFGPLLFFWFTTASYYYYACRLSLIIYHSYYLKCKRHLIPLLFLLLIELFSNFSQSVIPDKRYFHISLLSCLFLTYTLVIIFTNFKKISDDV